jgi:hypothetical protein
MRVSGFACLQYVCICVCVVPCKSCVTPKTRSVSLLGGFLGTGAATCTISGGDGDAGCGGDGNGGKEATSKEQRGEISE